jgi:hypothetical protein
LELIDNKFKLKQVPSGENTGKLTTVMRLKTPRNKIRNGKVIIQREKRINISKKFKLLMNKK